MDQSGCPGLLFLSFSQPRFICRSTRQHQLEFNFWLLKFGGLLSQLFFFHQLKRSILNEAPFLAKALCWMKREGTQSFLQDLHQRSLSTRFVPRSFVVSVQQSRQSYG